MEKVIVLMSGGIDSFLMTTILKDNYILLPLFVNYGQLALDQERKAVLKQTKFLELSLPVEIDINNLSLYLDNSLTNPLEFQNDFYPARNLLLLTIAGQIAHSKNINRIAIGIIGGSRRFPDCSYEFISICEQILSKSLSKEIIIFTPLSEFSKRDVLIFFDELKLPRKLIFSCQKENIDPCLKCPSCKELILAEKEIEGIQNENRNKEMVWKSKSS